jgi:hypothetical protein
MDLSRIAALGAIFILAAAPAAADETAAPAPVKPPAHVAKAKARRPKAVAPDGGFGSIKFSDPAAPLVGSARPPKRALLRDAATLPEAQGGGVSLGMKWHADNDHINNPYLPPWVPNGEGYNVQAGVKLGF